MSQKVFGNSPNPDQPPDEATERRRLGRVPDSGLAGHSNPTRSDASDDENVEQASSPSPLP